MPIMYRLYDQGYQVNEMVLQERGISELDNLSPAERILAKNSKIRRSTLDDAYLSSIHHNPLVTQQIIHI